MAAATGRWIAAGACAAAVAIAGASAAGAETAPRIAVVVGNDAGTPDEVPLRYAEADASRIAEILTTVGQIDPAGVVLLRGRSADEVKAAIRQAEARLVRAGGDGVLFVYYSGHADAEALHLGPSVLPLRELRALLQGSAVPTRVMAIDACRSGALTRIKGARPGPRFELKIAGAPNPRGLAIIASSAAGEDSQESDELRASFFTHHLASALVGAADVDGDGDVTLAEAFSYAARHTLASTATTTAGPQHPTYRLDLGGREDLVLTRPGAAAAGADARLGRLALAEPGVYLIRREGEAGPVAEVSTDAANRPLALPVGRYQVTRRAPDRLLMGTFAVAAAASTEVSAAAMRPASFERAARKGAAEADAEVHMPVAPAAAAPRARIGVAVGAHVAAGAAPGDASLGAAVRVWRRWTAMSMGAEARFDPQLGSAGAGDAAGTGRVGASLMMAELIPCAHHRWLAMCGIAGLGLLRGASTAILTPRRASSLYAALGARLGLEIPLGRAMALDLHIDGLAPLTPTTLEVDGIPAWTTPAVSVALGSALVAAF